MQKTEYKYFCGIRGFDYRISESSFNRMLRLFTVRGIFLTARIGYDGLWLCTAESIFRRDSRKWYITLSCHKVSK